MGADMIIIIVTIKYFIFRPRLVPNIVVLMYFVFQSKFFILSEDVYSKSNVTINASLEVAQAWVMCIPKA